jgi:hypothetical protein
MDVRHRRVFETHEEGKLASFGLQTGGARLQEDEQTTPSGVDRTTAEVVTQL